MIYAIRAVGTEFVKFGVTNGLTPKRRLDTMQTGCPYELELLATCDGSTATEGFIHLMLHKAKAHHRGEWFKWGFDAETIVGMMKDGSLKIAERDVQFSPLPKHRRLGRTLAYSQALVAKHGLRKPRHDYKPASDNPIIPGQPAGSS